MGITQNIIEQLTSSSGLTATTKPQGFNLSDDTFAKLLEKQMMEEKSQVQNSYGEMGIPTGFIIEPLEGGDMDTTSNNINEPQPIEFKETESIEIKDMKFGDYFSEFLSDKMNSKSSIMNMAVKHAANAYNNFGKSYIADTEDFVDDLIAQIKK